MDITELYGNIGKGTVFNFKKEEHICVSSKLIGTSYGIPKLAITTTKKTVVIYNSEEADDVVLTGMVSSKNLLPKMRTTLHQSFGAAKVSDLKPLPDFENLDLDRPWSEEEENLLHSGVSVKKLSILLNRDIKSINKRKKKFCVGTT